MSDKTNDSKPGKTTTPPGKGGSPGDHIADVNGPLSNDAIHKTEAKDKHPQGKTRHGGRSA